MPQERSASFSRCLLAGQTHGHPKDSSEGLGRLSCAVVPQARVRMAPCADGFPRPASCAEQGSQLCLGAWVRSQGLVGAAAPTAAHLEHSWAAWIVELV